jgi:hypothetical protein
LSVRATVLRTGKYWSIWIRCRKNHATTGIFPCIFALGGNKKNMTCVEQKYGFLRLVIALGRATAERLGY